MEATNINKPKEDFAKVFHSNDIGQVVVMLIECDDDDEPSIKFYFEPEGLGVCNVDLNFKDSDEGLQKAKKAFRELDVGRVEEFVGNILSQLEGTQ